MEGEGGDAASAQPWTCEACGCNTNQSIDRTCSICGTSNSGPVILRRGGAGYAARAGWLARGLGARRGVMNDDFGGLDDEDLWETVVDGVEMAGDDPESAMESLAMDISGMASAARNARMAEGGRQSLENASRQRFMEAARAFSQARETTQRADPDELLRWATENAASYHPRWANPAQLAGAGRTRSGNEIEVGEGERQNLAHLPPGAGSGRAIRTDEPLPRGDSLGSFSFSSPSNVGQDERQRRAFGFRVAFDHPVREAGASMGGCYLIGVTTSSFTAFGEQNGLQQSPFFWGIEDSGQKYEGSRYNPSARGSRRVTNSTHAIELGPEEAPMNAADVLYGSREVVTVVCDFESRTLTFWRDDTLLGTLVANLPRSGNLYPVAVPFNCGVTVAITGMDNDPLPLLRTFVTDWRKEQKEKDESLRLELNSQRTALIEDGKPTTRLVEILKAIFTCYCDKETTARSDTDGALGYMAASRLWYQCGMKLSSLDAIEEKPSPSLLVSFKDFLGLIEKVVVEDDTDQKGSPATDQAVGVLCEVGDKVELVGGFEKYGDASRGPLQPGDRGIVVELQRGPNGERRSIRVLYNGRRWWYQPQAVLSERTGLIESPGVWFLRRMLRMHSYDHKSLEPMSGKPVTSSSWLAGDVVVPKKIATGGGPREATRTCFGRIVAETSSSATSSVSRGRDAGSVAVEFVDRGFADAIGASAGVSSKSPVVLTTRRMRASKLVHSSVLGGLNHSPLSRADVPNAAEASQCEVETGATSGSQVEHGGSSPSHPVSEKTRSELIALSRLDRNAIESIRKECKRNPDTLASLFSAGLPDSILSAIDVAEKQLNSLEPREDLTEKISAVGELALFVADQLFSPSLAKRTPVHDAESDGMDDSPVARSTRSSRRVVAERLALANSGRRQLYRDAVARREALREEEAASDPQGLGASLQQRRSMLLSLMSRARRGNASYLNDMLERGNGGLPRDFALEQIAPPFGLMRGGQPFAGGPPVEFGQEDGWGDPSFGGGPVETTSRNQDDGVTQAEQAGSESDQPRTFLDSILRCRADNLTGKSGTRKDTGTSHTSFVRHLVANGLLIDSVDWVKASIDSQTKKIQLPSLQKSSTVLRTAVDEEGTPILQLAISFGCSADIVDLLVSCGTPIGETEVKMAAKTNQAHSLRQLLKHSSFPEDVVDLSECSPVVAEVFAQAKARRGELATKMREETGAFMVQLLRRLLVLGLSARRHTSPRVDLCSNAISELLVGNVLLRALQRTQKVASNSASAAPAGEQEACDRSGRFPVDSAHSDVSRTAQGLLGCLPAEIIAESLLSDSKFTTTYLLLIEDCLSSKELSDSAAGLTFLLTLLKKVPALRSSSEMERYGVAELVSFHDAFATSRLTEISSRKADSDGERPPAVAFASNSTGRAAGGTTGAVVACPKGHTAVLHVTRHSSFRCDLCGCGVERGRPMNGCRECDWDACEACTDRAESGTVKCSAIKDLASECHELLSDESPANEDDVPIDDSFDKLSNGDNSSRLKSLSLLLLEHDVEAVKELSALLLSPGGVTMHQFLTVVLPALHASLTGRSPGSDSATALRAASGRRNKKARVIGGTQCESEDGTYDSPENRVAFCKDIMRIMAGASPCENQDSTMLQEPQSLGNDELSTDTENLRSGGDDDCAVSVASSEMLRRLHQVLSFFESVAVACSSPDRKAGPPGSHGADLQALTKAVEVHLYPSAFGDSEANSHPRLVVHAEPLVPIADLESHVLRSCKLDDPSYVEFCTRLALDKAVIIEKSAERGDKVWQLAQVVHYDAATGVHLLRHATQWKRGQSRDLLRLGSERSDDLAALCYDGPETKVALAAKEYFILRRSPGGSAAPPERTTPRELRSSSLRDTVARQAEDDFRVGAAFSFMSARQRAELLRLDGEGAAPGFQLPTALKRTWSALSLAEAMRPLDLNLPKDSSVAGTSGRPEGVTWKCKVGDSDILLVCENRAECPPVLRVAFAAGEKLPGLDIFPPDTTIVGALKSLHNRHKSHEWSLKRSQKLFFSVRTRQDMSSAAGEVGMVSIQGITESQRLVFASQPFPSGPNTDQNSEWSQGQESRLRKLSSRSLSNDEEETPVALCEGLDEVCIQCMEVITLLSDVVVNSATATGNDKSQDLVAAFANTALSKKLTMQLDDSIAVVGGALPAWCTAAPSFAPRLFSYESRRMLLERGAFGVSRSALKQQEAKINVGRLRQRMGALRGRAVELVGEAFSGGADDPTALQLQADELYGMEEALAGRVRAAFRAVKWQEHSLQVAKAAVRRDKLVHDATSIMEHYANDDTLCRRRLEVRFDGESGFDAAAGDEAGVTRGFYADVAEALLACDNVAGVYCSNHCSYVPPTASLGKIQPMDVDEINNDAAKLPMWIPDMDSSAQVVIPTPRADKRSALGVYPRPLPKYHPQMGDVLLRFRFVGRLFAAAMRDGFMFPLPLSSAFLKLVQHGTASGVASSAGQDTTFTLQHVLSSSDLPRAGFLGGEVSAADIHVCTALNRLDAIDPPLSSMELKKRYQVIATDKNFARVALGKSYDCSFEDYFQDRTFVDPLDPTQGEDAVPLCSNGHKKLVTIYNIREWVDLAKSFILYDGVADQAMAFREGIKDFFSPDFLGVFTSEELQRDVCGLGDDVDNWDESAVRKLFKLDGASAAEALVAVAAIGGEGGAALSRRFGPTSPTITFLVKALLEASPKQRRQFLSFVTSVPIVTPGKIEVVPLVSPNGEFLPMQDPSCLPRTNTCARRMYLPKFETYEVFCQVLWAVVREESKFKGFYEWRGN